MMATPILSIEDPMALNECKKSLSSGGVVIFPTDTVYGIGCNPFSPNSIQRIFRVKGRDFNKALPILIGGLNQINLVTSNLDRKSEKLMKKFWPGPLTIILPKHALLPPNLSPHETIGIRMPNQSWLLDLIRTTGPLATTSANPSGSPEARNVEEVVRTLDGKVDLIIDGGQSGSNLPSTVVDCRAAEIKILRKGPISEAAILDVLN